MTKGLFALIESLGDTGCMYPIDIPHLARRGTLGSRVSDPTVRSRPRQRRFKRTRAAVLATTQRAGLGRRPRVCAG
jgi:hypothetical protein